MIHQEEKLLSFQDALNMKDKIEGVGIRGKIRIFELDDEFGNAVLKQERDNLVVLRGRTYALESLFKDPIDPATSGYRVNLNRTIALFKVGSGGADVASSPFEPFKPLYSDEDLAIPVPFVIENPNKHSAEDTANNPSVIESMSESQKKRYYIPSAKSSGVTEYYGKTFEVAPQWVFNKTTNEVYKKITLRIEANELRGHFINELSLVLGEYDSANNLYKDTEIFSRVTFETEPLTSLTKTLLIEYLIYA